LALGSSQLNLTSTRFQALNLTPILFLIYIRDICKPRPATFTFSYIDDICVGASRRSVKKIKKTLEQTAKALIREATDNAIEFEVSKTELLYASRKKSLEAEAVEIEGNTITPSKCVKWLGFYLDQKLSYKEHVQQKVAAAQQVFYQLQRLGNTQRGLSMQATRQLYIACIASIADYGIPLW